MMEDKPMTGEEVLQQILGALNGNGMQQAANGVYELCAYVDSMSNKFYRTDYYMDIDAGAGHMEQGGTLGCYCVTTDDEIYL